MFALLGPAWTARIMIFFSLNASVPVCPVCQCVVNCDNGIRLGRYNYLALTAAVGSFLLSLSSISLGGSAVLRSLLLSAPPSHDLLLHYKHHMRCINYISVRLRAPPLHNVEAKMSMKQINPPRTWVCDVRLWMQVIMIM